MDDVNPREGDLPSPVDPVDPPPSSDQSAYTPLRGTSLIPRPPKRRASMPGTDGGFWAT